MGLVVTWAFLKAVIDALTALVFSGGGAGGSGSGGAVACGLLQNGTVLAFTGAPQLTQYTTLDQLAPVEPTYPGYARQPLVWDFQRYTPDRSTYQAIAADVQFRMSDNTTPTTITGYGLIGNDGVTLLAAELFATPAVLITTDDALIFEPEIEAPLNGWGFATVKG